MLYLNDKLLTITFNAVSIKRHSLQVTF